VHRAELVMSKMATSVLASMEKVTWGVCPPESQAVEALGATHVSVCDHYEHVLY